MSVPAALYASLRSACERGTTTQLALDNSLAKGRLTAAEHAELSAILQAVLNPPPPPPPVEPTPEPAPTEPAPVADGNTAPPASAEEPAPASSEPAQD